MDNTTSNQPVRRVFFALGGVISLAISLVMLYAGYLIMTNVLPRLDMIIFVSLIYCVLPLLGVIGIAFGIAGLFQKGWFKLLPILGILLNLISFAPIVLFWILGLMVGLPFTCFESLANCY